jgi:hypothetical protein
MPKAWKLNWKIVKATTKGIAIEIAINNLLVEKHEPVCEIKSFFNSISMMDINVNI